jgi:outer membrane lipoprotein-sorting protein
VKHGIRLKLTILFLLLLAVQAGCISVSRRRVLPQDERLLPAKTASRDELFHQLEERSNSVQTLQGTIFLDLSGGGAKSGVLTEYHQTTAYVVVNRPRQIRFKVVVPIVLSTIADMVSDGRQIRVSIPLKNQFVVGDANQPLVTKTALANLRPQHLLDGLFVDIRPYTNNAQVKPLFREQVQGRRSYYVFSFIDIAGPYAQLLEELWIDRTDLQISRKQVFAKDGRIETDVEYSNYQTDGESSFPHTVLIQRPIEEYTLKMAFQKATLNQKLPDGAFELERPEGSDLVQVAR